MSLAELSGPLPPVCIKTGGKSQKLRPVRFKYRPASSYALLGLLFVGVLASRHSEVTLQLPVSREVIRDHWRRVLITVAGLVGGTTVFAAIGFAAHTQLAIWPALICCFGGLAILVGQQNFIQGRLTKNASVVLKDVSPAWVAVMRASIADRHLAAAAAHQQAAAAVMGYAPAQAVAPAVEQLAHVAPARPASTSPTAETLGFFGEPLPARPPTPQTEAPQPQAPDPLGGGWTTVEPAPPVD
ncbi:MAG: hypothetical protein QOG52_429 [Frankiaceae bacterium]|nr:hypothetical protein [Frankiaceae bacterium]